MLRRHIGADQRIARGAIFGLDLVGDVENVAKGNLLADHALVERTKTVRRDADRSNDVNVLQHEADFVHGARDRRAMRRLDRKIEFRRRGRRRQLTFVTGLNRAWQLQRRGGSCSGGQAQRDERRAQNCRWTPAGPSLRQPGPTKPNATRSHEKITPPRTKRFTASALWVLL